MVHSAGKNMTSIALGLLMAFLGSSQSMITVVGDSSRFSFWTPKILQRGTFGGLSPFVFANCLMWLNAPSLPEPEGIRITDMFGT